MQVPALQSDPAVAAAIPPFSAGALRWQLAVDTLLRWVVGGAATAVVLVASLSEEGNSGWAWGCAVAAGAWWLVLGAASARAWRTLPVITALLEQDPAQAEAWLAASLRRKPLQRSLRLMLYHRLALLRYRQARLGEAADICQALLSRRLAGAAPLRAQLLLMLVEARLRRRELEGAAQGLARLERMRLGLAETLQRTALRARFLVVAGRDAEALAGFEQTIRSAEMLPGSQCGGVHASLALAAARRGQADLAGWLHRRAELLCTPDQLASLAAEEAG